VQTLHEMHFFLSAKMRRRLNFAPSVACYPLADVETVPRRAHRARHHRCPGRRHRPGTGHDGNDDRRVLRLELETEPGPNGGFPARAVWNVSGSVGHWGHVHRRANRYRAGLGIEPVDGVWKLTLLDLLEEERLANIGSQGGG
jgi:hypothetical protein